VEAGRQAKELAQRADLLSFGPALPIGRLIPPRMLR
jgi:hypothetical protein